MTLSVKVVLSAVTILMCIPQALYSQGGLTDSRRGSSESHVYHISRDNLRKIYVNDELPTEHMLQRKVASYPVEKEPPRIERGNYMIVKTIDNDLSFTDYTVDDLYYKLVASDRLMLCLYDSSGVIIDNATVRYGGKTLRYDNKTLTYNGKKIKGGKVIEIDNKGVFHYVELKKYVTFQRNVVKKGNILSRTWHKIRHGSSSSKHIAQDRYTGFVVFSKPQYKPGETVKFKAYMTSRRHTPYNKAVEVRLVGRPSFGNSDTLLTTLNPYRPGMYEYTFTLTDSLKLRLDNNYIVSLNPLNKKEHQLKGLFRYKDYELKSISFTAEADKKEYARGDTVKLKLKVVDDNDMAVYGGKADVLILPGFFNIANVAGQASAFVPDTLWSHTIDMNTAASTEAIVPDSLFPQNISSSYRVQCTYMSADNEHITKWSTINRKVNDFIIDIKLEAGILKINELHKGKSRDTQAEIQVNGEKGEILYAGTAILPYSEPLPYWTAHSVTVKTNHAQSRFLLNNASDNQQLNYRFFRDNDSIFIKAGNDAGTPFWYTIRANGRDIASGHATSLNHTIKANDKTGYAMRLSYLHGGTSVSVEQSLPNSRRNMLMEVSTPTSVFPGQTAEVSVSLTDKKGRPVKDADITAYAFTSKFGDFFLPNLTLHGKDFNARPFDNKKEVPNKKNIDDKRNSFTWHLWKNTMGLDTMEYYKFLYPDVCYAHAEPTTDSSTLIAPYLVIDGAPQRVHILWIDGIMHYFSGSQQLNVYTSHVTPGKHNLKFRTNDRVVTVSNVNVEKGTKNIMSFDAAASAGKKDGDNAITIKTEVLNKKEHDKLSKEEADQLSSNLVTIDNNFGSLLIPNSKVALQLPVYLRTGGNIYYLNHNPQRIYNRTIRGYVGAPLLAGPFPKRSVINKMADMGSVFVADTLLTHIKLEGGNKYTLFKDFQMIKSWQHSPFGPSLPHFKPAVDFNEQPLTIDSINNRYRQYLYKELSSLSSVVSSGKIADSSCKLQLHVGKDSKGIALKPALILFVPEDSQDTAIYRLYTGAYRHFSDLPAGKMRVYLVKDHETCYSATTTLYPRGTNFLKVDSVEYDYGSDKAAAAFAMFDDRAHRIITQNPYARTGLEEGVHDSANDGSLPVIFSKSNMSKGIVSGTVTDIMGNPLTGATIIVTSTNIGATADIDGRFELPCKNTLSLSISFIGYIPRVIEAVKGYDYVIVMEEEDKNLDEVVVVAFGRQKSVTLAGAISGVSTKSSSDFWIRGVTSVNENTNPLIILNGLPYSGSIDHISSDDIISFKVLKDEEATAMYGSRGANGVIIIQTKSFSPATSDDGGDDNIITHETGNTMRRNFHDDAFWQPHLTTNREGKASFEVTYPDDITAWNAFFLAVGNKKQTDIKQLKIGSFKGLTARLSVPRFAVRGDSLNAVGRIANHLGDSVKVQRTIKTGESPIQDDIVAGTSHTDYIPVTAEKGDSLTLSYSLQTTYGYFDGEERSIPIIEQGLLLSHGDFRVLNDTVTYTPDIALPGVPLNIHADASGLSMLLQEIDKLDRYPYFCNEQIASKVKALLARRKISGAAEKDKDDKKINDLLRRLNKNKNNKGLWGWWNNGNSEVWISRQVVNAMLDAEEAGFKTGLDKNAVHNAFMDELQQILSYAQSATAGQLPLAKQELTELLVCLKRLGATVDYEAYLTEIDGQLESNSAIDSLKMMYALAATGLHHKINVDDLLKLSHKTMTGSIFWGDMKETGISPFGFMLPYRNNTECTVMAYAILKSLGGHDDKLEQIRNYFFERRRRGAWANTYESSRIMETILPDLLKQDEAFDDVSMSVNGKKVTLFPHTSETTAGQPIHITKEGAGPLFVSVSAQQWDNNPVAESAKGFIVETSFVSGNDTISRLTAGKAVKLSVSVTAESQAGYVLIEVPIPAGCSYDSWQPSPWRGKEAHREHFKDKVVIFVNELNEGKHDFTIDLIPRYSGVYHLNPAKVSLMYFPVFYGNETMTTVDIDR